ncbi:MAG: hypothetical protein ACO1TE_17415 [Prosthecobacter sp.]
MKTSALPSVICEILHALLLLLVLLLCCPARSSAQSFRFETVGDNTLSMLLIQEKAGSANQFLVRFKGAIQANVDGRVESIEGSIESLQAENADAVKVSRTELKDGTLVISTAQGQKHIIYDIHSNLAGRIREAATPDVTLVRAGAAALSATRP